MNPDHEHDELRDSVADWGDDDADRPAGLGVWPEAAAEAAKAGDAMAAECTWMGRRRAWVGRRGEMFTCEGRRPSRRDYGWVLLAIVGIKAVVCFAGVLAARHGELSRRDYERNFHHHRIIPRWDNAADVRFFDLWVVSDAQWYNAIAENGYPTREQFDTDDQTSKPKLIASTDTQLSYAFFPLWPLVVRVTQFVIADVHAAGFVAANVISVAALLGLFGFLARRVGVSAAAWAAVLLTASPFGMFLHVPFSESLFLLLTVATFAACERRAWWAVGVCLGLAVVTRPNGFALVVVPLTVGIVQTMSRPAWLRQQFPRAWWMLLAVLPGAGMLWHHRARTGDAWVFTKVQNWWGYGNTSMWDNFCHNTYDMALRFTDLPWHGFHNSQMDFIVLAVSAFVCLIGLRLLPAHYSVFTLSILVVPLLAKSDLMSYSRYALMAWPLFVVPALVVRQEQRRWVLGCVAALFLVFQLLNVEQFVNWHWVA